MPTTTFSRPQRCSITSHGLLCWALLAIAGAVIYYHRRFPLICFGVAFFFLLLAPTSSFFPIADFAAERRLYLPMLGILIAVGTAIARFVRPDARKAWAGVIVLAAVYSVGTYQRAAIWADPLALWHDTTSKSPHKERPWSWLGKTYNDTGMHTQAVQAWHEAEKYVDVGSRQQAHLMNNLGLAYANLGDRERALTYYRKAVEMGPRVAQFWANLAVAQLRVGREAEGWQSFERAARPGGTEPGVFLLRGQEYYQRERYLEAKQDFERVVAMTPEDPNAIRKLRAAEAMLARAGSSGAVKKRVRFDASGGPAFHALHRSRGKRAPLVVSRGSASGRLLIGGGFRLCGLLSPA